MFVALEKYLPYLTETPNGWNIGDVHSFAGQIIRNVRKVETSRIIRQAIAFDADQTSRLGTYLVSPRIQVKHLSIHLFFLNLGLLPFFKNPFFHVSNYALVEKYNFQVSS